MNRNTLIGTGVPFTRVARITGYLAKLDRFNNAKREEFKDRTKHEIMSTANSSYCDAFKKIA